MANLYLITSMDPQADNNNAPPRSSYKPASTIPALETTTTNWQKKNKRQYYGLCFPMWKMNGDIIGLSSSSLNQELRHRCNSSYDMYSHPQNPSENNPCQKSSYPKYHGGN